MELSRRNFLTTVSMMAAGAVLPGNAFGLTENKKLKVALIGVGIRGVDFWGKRLNEKYSDILEFVGLCDNNPGRLEHALGFIGVSCPTFSNFEKMVSQTKPDLVIVTTRDCNHHEFIIKGLEMGCDVLSEKPLTIDEHKCQDIIDAEKKSNKNLIVGFNYRWSPYTTKIKELLSNNAIGKITSVDFHWYLNTHHGASYFRRWHGMKNGGGTLLVHKATHHFDLLNWWINSDPQEVFAYGDLEHYGKNGPFRGDNCRTCQHKNKCEYYWDITKEKFMMDLYVNNEKYDGYIRDNCLFREEIDIYDKMSAQIKYKNNVVVNYSLTTYSPIEGWRVCFNGTHGRIEAWLGIPYDNEESIDQAEMHALEMDQSGKAKFKIEPVIVHKLWEDFKSINVKIEKSGHGGGDQRLHDKVFLHPDKKDEFDRAAGLRDGAMSVLIGIAARNSIESGEPVEIEKLTSLKPSVTRII
jgi:predicted dehydrogenase